MTTGGYIPHHRQILPLCRHTTEPLGNHNPKPQISSLRVCVLRWITQFSQPQRHFRQCSSTRQAGLYDHAIALNKQAQQRLTFSHPKTALGALFLSHSPDCSLLTLHNINLQLPLCFAAQPACCSLLFSLLLSWLLINPGYHISRSLSPLSHHYQYIVSLVLSHPYHCSSGSLGDVRSISAQKEREETVVEVAVTLFLSHWSRSKSQCSSSRSQFACSLSLCWSLSAHFRHWLPSVYDHHHHYHNNCLLLPSARFHSSLACAPNQSSSSQHSSV